ncbi:beta-ketoacyl-[acyl-carrier-protein] synthase family protein [Streptomyces sp. NPDC003011]
MPESLTGAGPGRPGPAPEIVITGLSAVSGFGRGTGPLLDGVFSGRTSFAPVTRFDTGRYRVSVAAELPGDPVLFTELEAVVADAATDAELTAAERASSPLLLAAHADPAFARLPADARLRQSAGATAAALATATSLGGAVRAYTSACVAGSTAVADAAAMISSGQAERVVAAGGYLVDEDHFALFDAGRALAADERVRAFSAGRKGLLLGDGVAAVVMESAHSARRRGAEVLARLTGWGRAGDAYHVSQPHPEGTGLARAIEAALGRARRQPADIGYVNAHGTGTSYSDAAEAAALHRALGPWAGQVPVSSSKTVHGHTLEASGLLELVITVHTVRSGRLPVNAGFEEPDGKCRLNLVLEERRDTPVAYALSLNSAFGGANTALVVGAP